MSDNDLQLALVSIQASLKRMEERLDELVSAQKEVKNAIWDPSKGLYAISAKQEADIASLKAQLASYSKGMLIVGSTLIGLIVKSVLELL